ncbi:hypothetical protein PHMEG_00023006 [Phytophthora megakarya]|uniref:Reverse transcriptase/retrotransposon-derived protein RNase H-like domain-containing protein n=1 Tax=Phytophthora megakarya TaxID=4795 RepID=A0A225VI32_9STRA|nr:hypothetical protein PHMEG_00023006 [Phytophthora megakarya]
MVDVDVLEFLGLDPSERNEVQHEKSGRERLILTNEMTAFKRNIPASSQMGPVLGRSSYIDDIGRGAPTWDQLWKHCCIGYATGISHYAQDYKIRLGIAVPDYAQKAALHEVTEEQIKARRDLSRAKESFEIIKRKIVSTPLLRHPDRSKPFMIIPHANRWAANAVLGQEYDGKILPVCFTGRVLNETETKYHVAERK